ncbi:ABC transporter permease [Nonomuraea fuscirosea]|uniref:ABC transporter permease n=1 Tax=Nonomuraea fuscirosea TaxID=1291556 RepID=UPI0034267C19
MTSSDAVVAGQSRAVAYGGGSGLWRASVARSSVELKSFFRNRQSLFFTLLLPIVLLLVLGSIFSGTVPGTHTDFKQMFVAGIIACGIMSVSFNGLAINIAIERDNGMIRRLASSPMPKTAYFVGKIVRVVVTGVLEAAILLVVGVALFHLPMPSDPGHWITFLWVLLLGAASCSLLAVAFSAVIPNARSAAAIVTLPFLVLQFISGVFFPYSELPAWMQTIAAFFPLKWMTQGLRSVFLPADFAVVEPAHAWELGRTAVVLGSWCAAALLLSLLTFRWRGANVR